MIVNLRHDGEGRWKDGAVLGRAMCNEDVVVLTLPDVAGWRWLPAYVEPSQQFLEFSLSRHFKTFGRV